MEDGLMVYYFYGNTRCPTCRSIESQSHDAVHTDFAAQLKSGAIKWKKLNYEAPSGAELGKKFEIQVPVVVLARMKDGEIEGWKRLDKVWALVGEKPAFAEYVRSEIDQMLEAMEAASNAVPTGETPDAASIPIPEADPESPPFTLDPDDVSVPDLDPPPDDSPFPETGSVPDDLPVPE
jgi:hypothetical protein